jgi:hypothetical protein
MTKWDQKIIFSLIQIFSKKTCCVMMNKMEQENEKNIPTTVQLPEYQLLCVCMQTPA